MLSSEIIHECRYTIVERFCSTFDTEIQSLLIYDACTDRYNFYVLGYFEIPYPPNPCAVVKSNQGQPLEVAQAAFPEYQLVSENYGF